MKRGDKPPNLSRIMDLNKSNVERARMEAQTNPDFRFFKIMGGDWLSLNISQTVPRGMMKRFIIDLKAPLSYEEILRRIKVAFRDLEPY